MLELFNLGGLAHHSHQQTLHQFNDTLFEQIGPFLAIVNFPVGQRQTLGRQYAVDI